MKKLKGSINYDFFNKMLTRGKEKGDMVQTAKALIEAIQPLPFYRVLNVNALSLNNAGAYISQELGYALAWGNEYMSQLTDAGVPAAIVAKKIKFNFGIIYRNEILPSTIVVDCVPDVRRIHPESRMSCQTESLS